MRNLLSAMGILLILFALYDRGVTAETGAKSKLNLNRCITLALENNHQKKASQKRVEAAEAQYGQAMSSFWPQVSLMANLGALDHAPLFVNPAQTFQLTLPGALTGGDPVKAYIDVPQQKIKVMDAMNLSTSLNVIFPVFTGGKRPALVRQAEELVKMKRQEAHKTELEIIYDVKTRYYALILFRKLYQIAEVAEQRMEATLEITENLYKNGSGSVKKTDYLQNKLVVESMRSMLDALAAKKQLIKAALLNTMAVADTEHIDIADTTLPYAEESPDFNIFLDKSYRFNPDWARINRALSIYQAKIKEAKSGYFPMLAFTGQFKHIENSYDGGMVSKKDRNFLYLGIAVQWPIFSGLRTKNKVREAQARFSELQEKKQLLKDGLALQLKQACLALKQSQQQNKHLKQAAKTSAENVDLNLRAYRNDLVKLQDVIQAQLMDSFTQAQYQKNLYDHLQAQAKLELIVGKAMKDLLK